jgi:4,5-dihydroxyphthalate decarboxylase
MTPEVILRTAIDRYGHTEGLFDGTITSSRVGFDFVEVTPINRAFRRMTEQLEFDVSEMAIVTFLQAREAGRPLVLVPLVTLNRFHHGSIVVPIDSPISDPRQLNGKRVGVRAYTQTTGLWIRGVLASEYGVDLDSITWVVNEGAHVASYVDPSNTERHEGTSLLDMLAAGEIDAWIGGREAAKVEGMRPVIADAAMAERDWFRRVRALPINHMLVVKGDQVERHPWLVAELEDLFTRAKQSYFAELNARGAQTREERFHAELLAQGVDPLPNGIEAIRRSLEVTIDFAFSQHLIAEKPTVDDVFALRLANEVAP